MCAMFRLRSLRACFFVSCLHWCDQGIYFSVSCLDWCVQGIYLCVACLD